MFLLYTPLLIVGLAAVLSWLGRMKTMRGADVLRWLLLSEKLPKVNPSFDKYREKYLSPNAYKAAGDTKYG